MNQTAIVIGAGVVGLCSALKLSQNGWKVQIIDPRAAGEGCSAGNPGGISTSSVLPAASPGVIHKVPGWLLDKDGPLTIRPSYLPRLAPWLIRFLKASAPQRYKAGVKSLYSLTRDAGDAWQDLLGSINQASLLNRNGHLVVYHSRSQFDAEEKSWQMRQELGLDVSAVTSDEIRSTVPALSTDYSLARRVNDNGWLFDPLHTCKIIEQELIARGAIFHQMTADDIEIASDGTVRVKAGGQYLSADRIILSAGAWSAKLAARLGDKIPLQPERGYSITWAEPEIEIPTPIFSPSEKIMAAPTAGGIRFAGTAEFTGFNSAPRWERAESLERLGRKMFPSLTRKSEAKKWTGLRPSTPDGLPVLGHSKRSNKVIYAFGHGHIGVTSAAVTAKLVDSLVKDDKPYIDCDVFSPRRF